MSDIEKTKPVNLRMPIWLINKLHKIRKQNRTTFSGEMINRLEKSLEDK